MFTTFKENIEYVALSFLIIILIVSLVFFDNKFYSLLVLGIPIFVLLLRTLITDYTKFLFLLILTIPLSFPMELTRGIEIEFPSEILIAFFALFIAIRVFTFSPTDKTIFSHPVSILLLTGLLWDIVCSLYSASPGVSFKRDIVSSVYIMVYYFLLIHLFSDTKNISKIYTLYIIGFVVPILYTLYIHAGLDFMLAPSALISRPFYNDHTIYGAALAFFIPYLIYSTIKKQVLQKYNVYYFSLSALFLIALFFSYSRAAWLSLLVASLFFMFTFFKHKLLISVVIIIVIALTLFTFRENIYETTSRSTAVSNHEDIAEHVQSVTNIYSDVSNAERINSWKSALRMFYDKPLTGFGPGTYQFYYGSYQLNPEMTRISTYQGNKGHAHSEYLNKLSETGWPGLLLFISTAVAVFYTAWRTAENTSDKTIKNLVRISAMGLLTFYIHAFFNGFIETDKIAMPVYATMASIVALDRANRKSIRMKFIKDGI
jgi:putative inorganic carbon (HCO3(-)) transporter